MTDSVSLNFTTLIYFQRNELAKKSLFPEYLILSKLSAFRLSEELHGGGRIWSYIGMKIVIVDSMQEDFFQFGYETYFGQS